ncbi:basic helix-loop-helix protein [Modicella reniformis]|uniref:Basic helix-loop-helix protein n=1 Tax=Modicella reniformis TaxID=1440133 RepID=A0A9P6MI03_9FUNG|nr:basic helix-loop-helix protein [Modicella reniformis]
MTSSSEIHVQEVLNNLNNLSKTIKRDNIESLDGSLTAAIAQHTAAAAVAAAVTAATQAQASSSVQQAQVEHDQNHVNHEELERIAQEHKQQQEHDEDPQSPTKQEQEQNKLVQETLEQSIASATAAAPAQENSVIQLDSSNSSTLATVPITAPAPPPVKPVAGSEEWHKMRRDNHKEVERRRRETINAGINDLAACIPNPDKNKGQILRQAVKYIQSIQEVHQKLTSDNETLTVTQFEREKALLEKNLVQSQLQTLVTEHDQLKRDFEALRTELEDLTESKKRQRTE